MKVQQIQLRDILFQFISKTDITYIMVSCYFYLSAAVYTLMEFVMMTNEKEKVNCAVPNLSRNIALAE